MKIIYVPLEKIPTRYTADWQEQFQKAFIKEKVKFITILGTQNEIPVEHGSVLDCYGTNQYKLEQMIQIIKLIADNEIHDDDVILFADAWFPSIETLFYIRNMTGKKFKIAGIYHAGSYDSYDFTSRQGMRNWAQHSELSWFKGLDIIFVATKWHKDLMVLNSGEFDHNKIFVTGIPFYSELLKEKYPIQKKENIIVFPHRLEDEKQPEKFDTLKKKYPKWTFIKTIEATSNREEYFKLLARSKVMISYALQETWGFSTLESMALGNYVIVPNRLSYRETVPDKLYRYSKESEISDMLEDFMNREELPVYSNIDTVGVDAISKMIRVMKVKIKEAQREREQEEQDAREEQLRIEQERQERKQKQAEAKAKREQNLKDNSVEEEKDTAPQNQANTIF